jgi:hypothetical protein
MIAGIVRREEPQRTTSVPPASHTESSPTSNKSIPLPPRVPCRHQNYLYMTYHASENDIEPAKGDVLLSFSALELTVSVPPFIEFDWCGVSAILRALRKIWAKERHHHDPLRPRKPACPPMTVTLVTYPWGLFQFGRRQRYWRGRYPK